MARPSSVRKLNEILAAAEQWKAKCLLADGSLFAGNSLWSAKNLDLMDHYFIQNPLDGKARFIDKFRQQLAPAPPQVTQLAAELLWVLLLFSDSIGGVKKRETVTTIWSWTNDVIDANHPLLAVLDYGIGGTGVAFNTYRPAELTYFIQVMQRWKALDRAIQDALLSDPWAFGNWVDGIPRIGGERQFRHMLLYLLFPDTYERISSSNNKREILDALSSVPFSNARTEGDSPAITVDRQLVAIRKTLESKYPNQEIDFYEPPARGLWLTRDEPEPSTEGEMPPPSTLASDYTVDLALEGVFMERDAFVEILDILRLKRNAILQGPPGVGKSFIAQRLAYALIGAKDTSRVQFIQFHQSYSYEDFVEGYRPTSGGGFELRQGIFRVFCKKALDDPQNQYVLVIDEINRGNLSKIFGELLLLIETDKRRPEYALNLAYSSDLFYVPPNLYLIGLMNTADRSLALVDYALRRRFSFIPLKPMFDSARFHEWLGKRSSELLVNAIVSRLTDLNSAIENDRSLGSGFVIGHSFFCPDEREQNVDEHWFQRVIKTEIEPLLYEYWVDDTGRASGLIAGLKAAL